MAVAAKGAGTGAKKKQRAPLNGTEVRVQDPTATRHHYARRDCHPGNLGRRRVEGANCRIHAVQFSGEFGGARGCALHRIPIRRPASRSVLARCTRRTASDRHIATKEHRPDAWGQQYQPIDTIWMRDREIDGYSSTQGQPDDRATPYT